VLIDGRVDEISRQDEHPIQVGQSARKYPKPKRGWFVGEKNDEATGRKANPKAVNQNRWHKNLNG